ncbi:GNAT family N-acetyltransferase [Lysobacter hankyongensis]|uniref:N-acetyltransferase domain-containing protein n=1 Tax=Lysobacter hankyongensis TaxID=1176535 RepID=A0ABP9AVI2_9GAMM
MDVRQMEPAELDVLAALWRDGWQDAHAAILPAALVRDRTPESFRHRLAGAIADVRVVGPAGAPLGFCIAHRDELYQLYVSDVARGTGVAASLLADAEARMCASGVETAWLVCAIGNARAATFYEKHGWRRVGSMISRLTTPDGVFPLEAWRYEKRLDDGPAM